MRSASPELEFKRSSLPEPSDKPAVWGSSGSLPRSLGSSSPSSLKKAGSVDDTTARERADTDPDLPAHRLVRTSAMSGKKRKLFESYRQKLRQSRADKTRSLPDSPSSSPAPSPPRSLAASTGHSSRESTPPHHVSTTSGEDSQPPAAVTQQFPQPIIRLRRPTPPVLPQVVPPKPVVTASPLARQDDDAVHPVAEHEDQRGGKMDFSVSAAGLVHVQEAQIFKPIAGHVSPRLKIDGDEEDDSRGEHEEPAAGESPKLIHRTLDRPKRKHRAPSREKLRERGLQSPTDDPLAGAEESSAQQKKRKPVPMPRRKQSSPAREPVHPSLLQAEGALQRELQEKLRGAGDKAEPAVGGPQPAVFDEFKKVQVHSPQKTIDFVDEFKIVQVTAKAAEPTEKTSPYDVSDEFRRVTPGKQQTEDPDHVKLQTHKPPSDSQPTEREAFQSVKPPSLEIPDSSEASRQSQVPQQERRWKRKNATRISRAKRSGRPSAHVPADDDFEEGNIREHGTVPDAV